MIRVAVFLVSIVAATVAMPAPGRWKAVELGHGPASNWSAPQTLVYQDSVAFRAAWSELYPSAAFRPALPAVDFAKSRVIVVALGTKPTGGYAITLDAGRVTSDSAWITVAIHTPPKRCGVTQQLTAPAVAIETPVHPVPFRIIFRERTSNVRCN